MHLYNALDVAENSDTEWFHNIIVNVFQVVLIDAPVLPPHEFPQLEKNIPLKVDAFTKFQLIMPIIFNAVFLCPTPEIVRG